MIRLPGSTDTAGSSQGWSRRSVLQVLVAVFLIAVAARIATAQYLDVELRYAYDESGYLTFDGQRGDEREYEGRGWNLVSGRTFWALPNGDGNAPPGYALLIAIVYSVAGRDLSALLWVNALIGGATAVLTYVLGRRLLSENAGLLAAAWIAIDPILLFWSAHVAAEAVTTAFAVWLLVAAGRSADRGWRVSDALVFGILAAGAILVRNQLAAVVGAVLVWALIGAWKTARIWKYVVVSSATCTALVVLVTAVGIARRPAGTVSQFEQLFQQDWLLGGGFADLSLEKAAQAAGRSLTEAEAAEILEESKDILRDTPAWKVMLSNWSQRLLVLWRLTPGAGGDLERLVYGATTALLYSLSALGVVLWLRRNAAKRPFLTADGTLLILTCLAVTALHMLLIAKARYRVPLHPLLAVWAAYASVLTIRRLLVWSPQRASQEAS